jgi:hypothetical protein
MVHIAAPHFPKDLARRDNLVAIHKAGRGKLREQGISFRSFLDEYQRRHVSAHFRPTTLGKSFFRKLDGSLLSDNEVTAVLQAADSILIKAVLQPFDQKDHYGIEIRLQMPIEALSADITGVPVYLKYGDPVFRSNAASEIFHYLVHDQSKETHGPAFVNRRFCIMEAVNIPPATSFIIDAGWNMKKLFDDDSPFRELSVNTIFPVMDNPERDLLSGVTIITPSQAQGLLEIGQATELYIRTLMQHTGDQTQYRAEGWLETLRRGNDILRPYVGPMKPAAPAPAAQNTATLKRDDRRP